IPIVFLMIPAHVELDWAYAVDRSLDTAVGCAVALAVGLLFWPRSGLLLLDATEARLRQGLARQLMAYRDWLAGQAPRPDPLPAATLSGSVERLETLLRGELAGPRGRTPTIRLWRRRVALWQSLRLHWVQWERLLAASELTPSADSAAPLSDAVQALASHLAGGSETRPVVPPPPTLDTWTRLARESGRSLLTLLALGEEQRPLLASSQRLAELRHAASEP
ncbi:MAG: FUSC family protein, partial [Cyanobacteriota bacterium]|nr:FUSC family protein [Cyanobacteriota bacterium]